MKTILISVIAVVVVSLAAVSWQFASRTDRYYTDADRIRQSVDRGEPRNVLWQPAVKLSAAVNSQGDDYEPRVSADGMHLFFVRGKAGANADLYVSDRTAAGWSVPVALEGVNSASDDLGPEPSADGASLYFYSDRSGGLGGYDLWVSRRGTDGWSPAENLGSNVNSGNNEYGPALTPDDGSLYFASNRPRSNDARTHDPQAWPATVREDLFRRDYDLYVATITEGSPGEARPLTELNTSFNEGAPAISSFGDFVYFCSDRPGGRGGFDLYRARRIRGHFGNIVNLGESINTVANELDPGLAIGGYGLYFSSDRDTGSDHGGASDSQALASAEQEGKYDLFYSTSREVFVESETRRDEINWAGLWEVIGPNLLWALLATLLLVALLAVLRASRDRTLSLMAKCLVASLLAHLLLMLLFNFWEVTAGLVGALHREGGTRVALSTSAGVSQIAQQIRGVMTDLETPAAAEIIAYRPQPEFEFSAKHELASLGVEPITREIHEPPSMAVVPVEASPSPSEITAVRETPRPIERVGDERLFAAALRVPSSPEPSYSAESEPAIGERPALPQSSTRPTMGSVIVESRSPVRTDQIAPQSGSGQNEFVEDRILAEPASARDATGPLISTMTAAASTPFASFVPQRSELGLRLPTAPAGGAQMVDEPADVPVAPMASATPRGASEFTPTSAGSSVVLAQMSPQSGSAISGGADVAFAEAGIVNAPDSRPTGGLAPIAAPPLRGRLDVPLLNQMESIAIPREEARVAVAESPERSQVTMPMIEASRGSSRPASESPLVTLVAPLGNSLFDLAPQAGTTSVPEGDLATSLIGTGILETLGSQSPAVDSSMTARRGVPVTPVAPLPASTTSFSELPGLRVPTETDPPPEANPPPTVGAVKGKVTDADTGAPLEGVVVRLDLPDDSPISVETNSRGRYKMTLPRLPEFFALSASLDGYVPGTENVPSAQATGTALTVNFQLKPMRADVVAVEALPDVHHLGNDLFEGRINSQFQKQSEGTSYEADFELTETQLSAPSADAEIRMLTRGVQCPHRIYINDSRLDRRLDRSPRDGSFGEFVALFNAALLQPGANTIRIETSSCNGDIDDFEFVNVRLHLASQDNEAGFAPQLTK